MGGRKSRGARRFAHDRERAAIQRATSVHDARIDKLSYAVDSLESKLPELIDLAIPRGGESLIRRVAAEARMPVLKHYTGNCHVYVDEAADLSMALDIVVNAKTHRFGVCNAAETVLVHAAVAGNFLSSRWPL